METRPDERILLYSELPPDEQRAVEAFVANHPESMRLLEDVKAIGAFLQETRRFGVDLPGDDAIAYFAMVRHLYGEGPPEHLRESMRRVQAVLSESPDLSARLERYAARIAEADRQSDARAQFEQLTGHHLDAARPAPPRAEYPLPASGRRSGRRPFGSGIIAGLATILAAYGILLVVGRQLQSVTTRLAWFGRDELSTAARTVATRALTGNGEQSSSDTAFLRALELLRGIEQSTLGLFPRFKADRLRSAQLLLRHVAGDPKADTYLHLEACYFLGKISLALGDVSGARDALHAVIKGNGAHAGDARRIVAELDRSAVR